MAAPIAGTILTASHCGASRRGPDVDPRPSSTPARTEVYDGGSRTDASRIGGVGCRSFATGSLRFNARGPDGRSMGSHRAHPRSSTPITAAHRRLLRPARSRRSTRARWRRTPDLARWLPETFAISLDETTVGRELKALGFAKISARPRHYAQNELAVEASAGEDPGEAPERRRDMLAR